MNIKSNARTQGYWKTHETSTITGGYWTMDNGTKIYALTIGCANYTPNEVVAIMNMSTGTGTSANAILILFDQLVAAKLNVLNMVTPDTIDSNAITAGDNEIKAAAKAVFGTLATNFKMIGTKKGTRVWAANPNLTAYVKAATTAGAAMIATANTLDKFNNTGT